MENIGNLKAGGYVIGDPCYMLRGTLWDKILKEHNYFHREGKFTVKDTKNKAHDIAVYNTGGDGGHFGTDDFEYGVDSGSLAAIPCAFAAQGDCLGPLQMGLRFCKVTHFAEDFACYSNKDYIAFGDLVIEKIWS